MASSISRATMIRISTISFVLIIFTLTATPKLLLTQAAAPAAATTTTATTAEAATAEAAIPVTIASSNANEPATTPTTTDGSGTLIVTDSSEAPTTTAPNSDGELPAVTSISFEKLGDSTLPILPAKPGDPEEDSTVGSSNASSSSGIDNSTSTTIGGIFAPEVESRSISTDGEVVNLVHKEVKEADESSDNSDQSNGKLTINSDDGANEDGDSDDQDGASINSSANSGSVAQSYRKSAAPSHLNMSQIDDIYVNGRRSEQATVEAWQAIGNKLKKGIGSLIGSVVPLALNMSQEARISSNCSGAMLKWVLSMNQLKAWALRMLDASGKPVAGLLEGSMTMFGNYRQCLRVRAPDDDEIEFAGEFKEYFRGKYCIIQAKPWLPEKSRFYNLNAKLSSLMPAASDGETNEKYDQTIFEELNEWLLAFNFVNIRFDLCVPSVCSREDIQKAVNYLLQNIDLKARVSRCEMDMPGPGRFGVASQVESGSVELSEALANTGIISANLDNQTLASTASDNNSSLLDLSAFGQLGWIVLPLVALLLVSIATLLSLTIGEDDDDDGRVLDSGDVKSRKNRLKHAIKSLSLRRSLDSHVNVDYDQLADDKPLALYGVRFVIIIWIILVESAVNLKFEYLRELMMLKDLIFWWPLQFIINSTLQYDSLILLTAFTMGYKNCLNDRANSSKSLIKFVVDKYVRIMPSVMLMVALVILLPLAYRGPVWNDYVTKQSAVCQSTGWLNSMFLQNYLPYEQICLPQTWLLCVEFQLILIMAPLVYYLNNSYTTNFGHASNADNISGNGNVILRQQGLSRKSVSATTIPNRWNDASRPFYWLWTTPGSILAAFIALGLGSCFYNVYSNELPPSWFYTMADPDSKALYFGKHMTKIWTHLAVFAMGILAGVECHRATKNVHRGYRSSNINFMSTLHTNTMSNHHKSKSVSATSLPIMLARQTNGGINSSSSCCSSSSGSRDQWNANTLGSASCSAGININETHHDQRHSQQQQLQQQQHYGGSSADIENNANNINGDLVVGGFDGSGSSNGSCGGGGGICSLLLDALGFITAITIMSAIIFSTHDWALNDLPNPFVAGLYDAGSRFLWSLAMIWILFRLSVPNKDRSFSLLAKLFGHPLMVSLGKLSFLIYIIHPFVHTAVLAIQEQPIYSSWLMLFHIFIGNMTITVILASLVSLFVEMPCRNLFRRCGTSLLLTQASDSSGGSTTSTNIS